MADEIERKWIAQWGKSFEELIRSQRMVIIEQFYTVIEDDEEVRFRRQDDEYFQTIKKGNGLERTENEIVITKELYESYKGSKIGSMIRKDRYKVKLAKNILEIDVYHSPTYLPNHVIVEVEFSTITDAKQFDLAKVVPNTHLEVIREVTTNKAFKNKNIARYGFPK